MTDRALYRASGVAAIAGGAVRVGLAFVPWQSNVAWLEAVAFGIDVALLFGLFGIWLAQRAALGIVGLIAFVVAEIGIASIVGPDAVAFGIDTYQAGVVAISLGLTGLGAVMLWKRAGTRVSAACWIASTVIGAFHFLAGGVLFALGFVAAGVELYRRNHA